MTAPAQPPNQPRTDKEDGKLFVASNLLIGLVVVLGAVAVIAMAVMEAKPARDPASGQLAPDFVIDRFGGGKISLAEERARGKVVMVDFWATWCGPCVDELPWLVKLAKEYEPRGLVFIAANHEGDEDAKIAVALFLERLPELRRFTGFADDALMRAFGVQALPSLYFIGKDGTIIEGHRGALTERQLRKRIEKVLDAAR